MKNFTNYWKVINMKTTKQVQEELAEFKSLADPLIKYLCENHNPHSVIIIDSVHAELLNGEIAYENQEFIID